MRTSAFICAAMVGAMLLPQGPSAAQSKDDGDVTALSGVDVVAPKPQPTPLSGLDVVVPRKAPPTAVSGIDVVVHRATPLSGVTVGLKTCPEGRKPPDPEIPAPRLVSTFPEKGAKVRPGVMVLRLTFDRPMTCIGLLDTDGMLPNPCPAPLSEPMISRDRRTFLTVCMIMENRRYGMRLHRFMSLAGHTANVSELVFDTSTAAPASTVGEALVQDRWMLQMASAAP